MSENRDLGPCAWCMTPAVVVLPIQDLLSEQWGKRGACANHREWVTGISTRQMEAHEAGTFAAVTKWMDVMTPAGRARVMRYLGDKYSGDGVEVA